MRWQQLFGDLQTQFEEAEAAAERGEAATRARLEMGTVALGERLSGALGAPVALRCRGAARVAGTLVDVGPDWLLLDGEMGREVLVALPAVRAVTGAVRWTAVAAPTGSVALRLDFRRALRGLARDRSQVTVLLDDGGLLTGTVDRVGADYCELAEHPPEELRRAAAVRAVHLFPLGAISVVTRAGEALPG